MVKLADYHSFNVRLRSLKYDLLLQIADPAQHIRDLAVITLLRGIKCLPKGFDYLIYPD